MIIYLAYQEIWNSPPLKIHYLLKATVLLHRTFSKHNLLFLLHQLQDFPSYWAEITALRLSMIQPLHVAVKCNILVLLKFLNKAIFDNDVSFDNKFVYT